MRHWRTLAASAALALLAPAALAQGPSPAQARKIVSEQLLYPRDARYTLPSSLPAEGAAAAKNAEWIAVARALGKAGLARVTESGGHLRIDGVEQSLDVVVPSMNLRYETTALNVVLGRWDIEVSRVANEGGAVVAHGKRRLVSRSRAYAVVAAALPPAEPSLKAEQDGSWEIRRTGAGVDVVENLR